MLLIQMLSPPITRCCSGTVESTFPCVSGEAGLFLRAQVTCPTPGRLPDPSKKFSKLHFFIDSLGSAVPTPEAQGTREIRSLPTYFPRRLLCARYRMGSTAVMGSAWPVVMQAVVKREDRWVIQPRGVKPGHCVGLSRHQWGSERFGARVQEQPARVRWESLCCVAEALPGHAGVGRVDTGVAGARARCPRRVSLGNVSLDVWLWLNRTRPHMAGQALGLFLLAKDFLCDRNTGRRKPILGVVGRRERNSPRERPDG